MDPSGEYLVCRLCLRKGLSLIDILEEDIEQCFIIKEAIEDLLHFKTHKGQGVPWFICPICCAKLDDFRNFKLQCLHSNKKFRSKWIQHEDHSEKSTSPDMVDIDYIKTEIQEFNPQVVNTSSIQPEQEEEMLTDDHVSMEMDSMACSSEKGVIDAQSHVIIGGCAADFWRGTEAALGIRIPKYLKNILKMNGCDNGLSMTDFDVTTQVPVLERFVREDMSHVIPLDCFKEDYYGIFEKCPERFRIVDGHMNILIRIAEYWKMTHNSRKLLQRKNKFPFSNDVNFHPKSLETSVKASGQDWEEVKNTAPCDLNSVREASQIFPRKDVDSISSIPNCNLETRKAMENTVGIDKDQIIVNNNGTGLFHLEKERCNLLKMIEEHLSESLVKCNKGMENAISDFQSSNIITKFGLIADVQCFLCSVSIRSYKIAIESNTSKWITSNYIRHVVGQHFLGSKKNRRKSVSPTETNANSVFSMSSLDKQNVSLIEENLLGNPALEDYCEEDTQIEVGSFYDETPSKKKRAQYKLDADGEV